MFFLKYFTPLVKLISLSTASFLFAFGGLANANELDATASCEKQYPKDAYTPEDREQYVLDCIETNVGDLEEEFEETEEYTDEYENSDDDDNDVD